MDTLLQFFSHVGSDGLLKLEVSAGLVDTDVVVTVRPVSSTPRTKHADEDWHSFVKRTYGSLAHVEDFEEPEDLPPQDRDWS